MTGDPPKSETVHTNGAPSFTERYIQRDQGRVYACDYDGAGPAFVLLHGFLIISTFTIGWSRI